MKLKIFLLTAALTLSITACHTTNDPLEVKIDEVLSKNEEIENKTDVNNDLHVDNSVENVENSQSKDKPAVENSPDSTVSEDENEENHDFVKDTNLSEQENPTDSDTLPETETDNSEKLSTTDPEKVENLTPDDIFYINGVPHIKATIDGEAKVSETAELTDFKKRYQEASAVIVCYVGNSYLFNRDKNAIKNENFLPDSHSFSVKVTTLETLKCENYNEITSIITFGGEISLENYQKSLDTTLDISIFPENTVIDLNLGDGNIPHKGDICLYFLEPLEENLTAFYVPYNGTKYRTTDTTGTTYIIRDGGIYFGDEYIGNALEILTELRELSINDAENVRPLLTSFFYVGDEPRLRKSIRSTINFATYDSGFLGLEDYFETRDIAVVAKVISYDGDNYDSVSTRESIPTITVSDDPANPTPPVIIGISDRVPIKIEIIEVLKDEDSALSGLKTFEAYYTGGELTLEQYKKHRNPNFPIELYPENTIVECGLGASSIPRSGNTYLLFFDKTLDGSALAYETSAYELYVFEVKDGHVFLRIQDLGSIEEISKLN
ncbi:MAG: hypothetical protein IJE51_00715 [Clostridia bacterium]|nr:hypothetical protein [Clostridia bacterium]